MSILVVNLVPEGILFAADRNVTESVTQQTGQVIHVVRGQSQRPKVLKWPNREAIIGYVGEALMGKVPMDEWLYHSFIGKNLEFKSFGDLANNLTVHLNKELCTGGLSGLLLIHIGGFDLVNGEWTPVVWFVRNASGISPTGDYVRGNSFVCTEELSLPHYFGGKSGNQIRADLIGRVKQWGFFSFRQGWDLGSFNMLDQAVRFAMQIIVEKHPAHRHPFPTTLDEWAKHARMAVLSYGAYFQAFYEPFEQFVGGGADVVWVQWP